MFRAQLRKSLGLRMPRKSSAMGDLPVMIVGPDHVGVGSIEFDGTVQVDGCIEGDIRCGRLVITAGGRVDGAVSARTVHLDGTVNGPIDARRVFLGPTAIVKGNIAYETLTVATGASVSGICQDRSRIPARPCGNEAPSLPSLLSSVLVWSRHRKAVPTTVPPKSVVASSGRATSMRAVWQRCQQADLTALLKIQAR